MLQRIFICINITIRFVKFFYNYIILLQKRKREQWSHSNANNSYFVETNRDYYLLVKRSTERTSLKKKKKNQEIDLKLIHYSLHEKSKQKEKRGRIGTTSKRLPFFLANLSSPVQRSRCKPFSFNRIRSQASFHLPSRHFSLVNNG